MPGSENFPETPSRTDEVRAALLRTLDHIDDVESQDGIALDCLVILYSENMDAERFRIDIEASDGTGYMQRLAMLARAQYFTNVAADPEPDSH